MIQTHDGEHSNRFSWRWSAACPLGVALEGRKGGKVSSGFHRPGTLGIGDPLGLFLGDPEGEHAGNREPTGRRRESALGTSFQLLPDVCLPAAC